MEERIEDYFQKQLSDSERQRFESDLKTNPEFAESVAFYLLVKSTAEKSARDKKLSEKHLEWQNLVADKPDTRIRKLVYYAAAAILLIAFGLGWYFLNANIKSREEMANVYVHENFSILAVQMDGEIDSLQQAINAYNNGEYGDAENRIDAILASDPKNTEAQKLAGIVSLRLKNYDKAITCFHKLGEQKDLFSNPGKFYEAIALIQRGLPLDKKAADRLLREVIDGNLEGKEEAVKWVK